MMSAEASLDQLHVLVVSEDPLARAGLVALLDDGLDIRVAAQFGSPAELAAVAFPEQFDAVVWDQQWRSSPDGDAWDDVRSLDRPVVALAADDLVARDAWAAGAAGVLRRDASPSTLRLAIRAVAHGLITVSDDFGSALRAPQLGQPGILPEPLTRRELEVLRLIGEGLPNKQIAARLDITEHTVKFHVNGLLSKLGVQSRTEAAILANRMGLLPL